MDYTSIKLSIYEAYDNGEIDIEEKEDLLLHLESTAAQRNQEKAEQELQNLKKNYQLEYDKLNRERRKLCGELIRCKYELKFDEMDSLKKQIKDIDNRMYKLTKATADKENELKKKIYDNYEPISPVRSLRDGRRAEDAINKKDYKKANANIESGKRNKQITKNSGFNSNPAFLDPKVIRDRRK